MMLRLTSTVVALAVTMLLIFGAGHACAQDDELLAVSEADLPALWTRSDGDLRGEIFLGSRYRAGCTSVSLVIEANGTISNVKVLRAWPDTEFGDMTTRMLRSWRYEPTALNADREAVFTTLTFVHRMPDAERRLGSNLPAQLDYAEIGANCVVEEMRFGDKP